MRSFNWSIDWSIKDVISNKDWVNASELSQTLSFHERIEPFDQRFGPLCESSKSSIVESIAASDNKTCCLKSSLTQCFKSVSKGQFLRKYRALRGVFLLTLWEFAHCYCTIEFQLRSVQSSSVPVSSLASSLAISIIKLIIRRIPFFSCGFKIWLCLRIYLNN